MAEHEDSRQHDLPQVTGESRGSGPETGTNIGRGGDALVQDDVALGRPATGRPVERKPDEAEEPDPNTVDPEGRIPP